MFNLCRCVVWFNTGCTIYAYDEVPNEIQVVAKCVEHWAKRPDSENQVAQMRFSMLKMGRKRSSTTSCGLFDFPTLHREERAIPSSMVFHWPVSGSSCCWVASMPVG